jgi:pyrroloquinoline-quinone synthase
MTTTYSIQGTASLRRLVDDHPVLRHPFLEKARCGRLTVDQLRAFAVEEIFVSLSFPALLAEVICRIPYVRDDVRHTLIVNLYEEGGCGRIERSHARLLQRLAANLGVPDRDLSHACPVAETQTYVDRQFEVCRTQPFSHGLAAIGYANEYLVLLEYPPVRHCCKAHGFSDEAVAFFDANVEADTGHMKGVEEVLSRTCVGAEEWRAVAGAVSAALDARVLFYDGLWRTTEREVAAS